eukprot:TRINITY_DN3007_c0_g1_i5.p1 TRINITY_DN3007_c0_g1~~TRINITY_DN3007_c0_g1_i5.p1  ORF type:complete len:277 (-),score=42.46 TRINITY_DN3007_c0_g1_i5:93-923(-)
MILAKIKTELQPYMKNMRTVLANSASYELSYSDFESTLKLISKALYAKKHPAANHFSLLLNSISPFSVASYSIPLNAGRSVRNNSVIASKALKAVDVAKDAPMSRESLYVNGKIMKSPEQLKNSPNSQVGIKLKKMLWNKISLYTSHTKRMNLPLVNSTKNSLKVAKNCLNKSEIGHYTESKKNSYSTIDPEYYKDNITLSNKEMLHEIYGTFSTIQPGKGATNNRYKKVTCRRVSRSRKSSFQWTTPPSLKHTTSPSYQTTKMICCIGVGEKHFT